MKANKITPNFSVEDVRETVKFYEAVLGFKMVMAVPESQDRIEQLLADEEEYVYALVVRDNVELMFQRVDSFRNDVALSQQDTIGASVSFYMEVEGVEAFYNVLKNNRDLTLSELKTAWYGMLEFYVRDINGYILGFAQRSGQE